MTDADGKKNTIIADNKPICYDGFKPDDTIVQELFENLLDHHPNFVYTQEKKKRSEKSGVKKYALPRNSSKQRRKIQRNDQSPCIFISNCIWNLIL